MTFRWYCTAVRVAACVCDGAAGRPAQSVVVSRSSCGESGFEVRTEQPLAAIRALPLSHRSLGSMLLPNSGRRQGPCHRIHGRRLVMYLMRCMSQLPAATSRHQATRCLPAHIDVPLALCWLRGPTTWDGCTPRSPALWDVPLAELAQPARHQRHPKSLPPRGLCGGGGDGGGGPR